MKRQSPLMTASEVGRRLGLSADRVRQLARSGRLPPDQETQLGRFWLRSTVDAFALVRLDGGRELKERQEVNRT
jgi:hypothetical protein